MSSAPTYHGCIGLKRSCPQCSRSFMSVVKASKRFACEPCKDKDLAMWETGEKVTKATAELESSLTFLSFQFDGQPKSGILGGDVVIIVQGLTDQPLHAHKFILASKSPVLCKMFDTNMLEKETGILRIDDTTISVMRSVVQFCYNAEIEFTDEVTSEEVLNVAHKYEIDLLTKICVRNLSETIHRANLLKRLKLARKYQAIGLEEAASNYFKRNFDDVIGDVLSEFC